MAKRKKSLSDLNEEFSLFHDIEVKSFYLEFKNSAQKLAWSIYQQHDILFMLGAAGTGKTHLAMAFAIHDILAKEKSKIVMTRPVVEAGESLGFLPGTFDEKINPYMTPLYDCMEKLTNRISTSQKEKIVRSHEVAPLAYLRGRTFDDAICILDESQNCSYTQLKLFLTRMGQNCKIIITGDQSQSDLGGVPALVEVVKRLETAKGVGVVHFKEDSIVRHPLVAEVVKRLAR